MNLRDEHLSRLQEELRRIRVAVGVQSIAAVTADTSTSRYLQFDPVFSVERWFSVDGPLAVMDVPAFRRDYQSMCSSPIFGGAFPRVNGSCDPIRLEGLEDYVDDVGLGTRLDQAIVRWSAPDSIYEDQCTYFETRARTVGRCSGTTGSTTLCTLDRECGGGRCITRGPTPTCGAARPCPTDHTCDTNNRCVYSPPACTPNGGFPTLECATGLPAGTTTSLQGGSCALVGGTCVSVRHYTCPGDVALRPRGVPVFTGTGPTTTVPPVLSIQVPFRMTIGLGSGWDMFLRVDDDRVTIDYRLQVSACDGNACPNDGAMLFSGYRGAPGIGDLSLPSTGLTLTPRGRFVSSDIDIQPGALCAIIGPMWCEAIFSATDVRAKLNEGIVSLASSTAGALAMLSRPVRVNAGSLCPVTTAGVRPSCVLNILTCNPATTPACAAPPAVRSAIAITTPMDLGPSTVFVPDGTATATFNRFVVGAAAPAGGAIPGDGLVAALAETDTRSNSFIGILNFNVSAMHTLCGRPVPTPASPGPWTLPGMCAGVASPAPDPLEFCDYCAFCVTCGAPGTPGRNPACVPLCDAPAGSVPFDLSGNSTLLSSPRSIAAIPQTQTMWQLLDMLPNFASELHRIVSAPFAEAGVRAVEALSCPSDPQCLPGEVGAVVVFDRDTDGDGVVDRFDNCRGTATVGPTGDSDGDGFGDACDRCPNVSTPGSNIASSCDCDVDRDGCANEGVDANGAACQSTFGDGYFDERPTEPTAGATACRASERTYTTAVCRRASDCAGADSCDLTRGLCFQCPGYDFDGDNRTHDCDPDDDGDGVFDDGAGDGVGTYTPCSTGVFTNCDDNCRLDPNNTPLGDVQTDSNSDGHGDACTREVDPLCGGPTPPPVCGLMAEGGVFDRSSSGVGPRPLPICIDDHPGCLGPIVLNPPCDRRGNCLVEDPPFIAIVDAITREIARVPLTDVAGLASNDWSEVTFVDVPDQDNDGLADWALGFPNAHDGAGALMIVSSSSGRELVGYETYETNAHVGAALARIGSTLYVGAPGATGGSGEATGAVLVLMLAGELRPSGAFFGDAEGDAFGASLSIADDVLFVGSPGADTNGFADSGAVYALDGYGVRRVTFAGPRSGTRIGATSAAILPRKQVPGGLFVGSPDANGGQGLVVHFDLRGHIIDEIVGDGPADRLGATIAPAADFDGDTLDEVAIAAPGAEEGAGEVLIVREDGTVVERLVGGSGYALGESAVTPGDLDRDGRPDLVLGAPGAEIAGRALRGGWTLLSGFGGTPNTPGDPLFP